MQTGGVREQPPMQKLPQSANADSFLACRLGRRLDCVLACRLGRRLDCVPLAHGSLREGASLRDGGVREQLSSPKQPFSGECPLCPSVSYGSGILRYRSGRRLDCVPPAHGAPFSPWMRKGGEKNHMGRHLDTPGEIILQARLRMNFEGGQGSFFFNAGQRHRETTRSLASLLFSHSGSFFFITVAELSA